MNLFDIKTIYRSYKIFECNQCASGMMLLGYKDKKTKELVARNCSCSKDLIDEDRFDILREEKRDKDYLHDEIWEMEQHFYSI